MNTSVYIFGNLGNGYAQYPMDSNQSIFQEMFTHLKGRSMIATHRDTDIIEYCYFRRLNDNQQYVGICATINGVYLGDPVSLFSMFENVYSTMVVNGEIVQFENNGTITSKVTELYEKQEEIDRVAQVVQSELEKQNSTCEKLPVLNFGVANTDFKEFNSTDPVETINKAIAGYPWVYIFKDTKIDTATIMSCRGVFTRMNKANEQQAKEIEKLKSDLSKLKNKQRNMLWVCIFAIVAIILGVVVWNKVLFPSEVTKKDMGEFVYYGPMDGGEPNGVGVAIYHEDDPDGRLYYYGNFEDGQRIDENAIMFYRDGSYFRGSMDDNEWKEGTFFDVENEHFVGEFQDNNPWNGMWYKHVPAQRVTNGR